MIINTTYNCSMTAGFGIAASLPPPPPFSDDGRTVHFAVYVKFRQVFRSNLNADLSPFQPILGPHVLPRHAFLAAPPAVTRAILSAAGVEVPPGFLAAFSPAMSSFAFSAAASAARILPLCVHVTAETYYYPYYNFAPIDLTPLTWQPEIETVTAAEMTSVVARVYGYDGDDEQEESETAAEETELIDEAAEISTNAVAASEDGSDFFGDFFSSKGSLDQEAEIEPSFPRSEDIFSSSNGSVVDDDDDDEEPSTSTEARDLTSSETTETLISKEQLPSLEDDQQSLFSDLHERILDCDDHREDDDDDDDDELGEALRRLFGFPEISTDEPSVQIETTPLRSIGATSARDIWDFSAVRSSLLEALYSLSFRLGDHGIGNNIVHDDSVVDRNELNDHDVVDDNDDDEINEIDDDDDDEEEEINEINTDNDSDDGIYDEWFMLSAVPASRSSIEALEEVTTTTSKDQCAICMEHFSSMLELNGHDDRDDDHDHYHDDDHDHKVVVVRMPCSHLYHKECIVQWLEKSHSCPLCRYAMPTSNSSVQEAEPSNVVETQENVQLEMSLRARTIFGRRSWIDLFRESSND